MEQTLSRFRGDRSDVHSWGNATAACVFAARWAGTGDLNTFPLTGARHESLPASRRSVGPRAASGVAAASFLSLSRTSEIHSAGPARCSIYGFAVTLQFDNESTTRDHIGRPTLLSFSNTDWLGGVLCGFYQRPETR